MPRVTSERPIDFTGITNRLNRVNSDQGERYRIAQNLLTQVTEWEATTLDILDTCIQTGRSPQHDPRYHQAQAAWERLATEADQFMTAVESGRL